MVPVIKIENLSKQYRLGFVGTGTITQDLKRWWHIMRGKPDPTLMVGMENKLNEAGGDYVWALRDINFEVEQGEVLGIIGKNGAGKSTLLKILSRVTTPTTGSIKIKGRVASLLEVGTGFHPELTGRENIFLNGAILGMTKTEIRSKLDEIVDFAGIEKYIDTPVKRYSSGMYVRLGFAVAAHLDPEILIVDEVLAVGDAEFQKKAIGKMQDVSRNEGRTVLFVSHSMTSIKALCNKALLLSNGKTNGKLEVNVAINQYLGGEWRIKGSFKNESIDPSKSAIIHEIRIKDIQGNLKEIFATYEKIVIEFIWENLKEVPVTPNFYIENTQGIKVMLVLDTPVDWDGKNKIKKGVYINTFIIPSSLLNANDFILHCGLNSPSPLQCHDFVMNAINFSIIDKMDEKTKARGDYRTIQEEYILWPALECSFKLLDNYNSSVQFNNFTPLK